MKIAIIPARGGSQRIKDKNIIDFCGKPMISYALEVAKKSKLFDKIHVSTDSEKIKSVVSELGYSIDFMRSPELADNFTGIFAVLKWVLNQYVKEGVKYDDVCCIFPAVPLLESKDLREGYMLFKKCGKRNPLLATAQLPVPVERTYRRDIDGYLVPVDPESIPKRSQDFKPVYYDTGTFSYFQSDYLLEDNSLEKTQFVSYVLPKDKVADIDDMEDLRLAEALYLGNLSRKSNRVSVLDS